MRLVQNHGHVRLAMGSGNFVAESQDAAVTLMNSL